MAIKVKTGIIKAAQRWVIYGPEGVGKTSLAASSPGALLIDADDGSGTIASVARYDFGGEGGHVPHRYSEIFGAIEDVAEGGHGYRTLVLDSLDRIESLMIEHICERDGKNSIEEYGYGKGWTALLDEARMLCALLDSVRAKGIDVIVVAHSTIRKFSNPAGTDYDRFQLKCSEKVAGFFREWCYELGFLRYDEGAKKASPGESKSKGWSTGARILELDRSAAWDAKCRLPLPAQIAIPSGSPWSPIEVAIDRAWAVGADDLIKLIHGEVARIGDPELGEKVASAIGDALGNVDKLQRFLSALRRRPALKDQIAA